MVVVHGINWSHHCTFDDFMNVLVLAILSLVGQLYERILFRLFKGYRSDRTSWHCNLLTNRRLFQYQAVPIASCCLDFRNLFGIIEEIVKSPELFDENFVFYFLH